MSSGKKHYTRKDLLGVGGAALAGLGAGSWTGMEQRDPPSQVPPGSSADLILVNGRVYTVDDDLPRAEAFAVKDGYFIAVGSSDDVRNLAGPDTTVVDAGGRTVTPGFIDAHCHPSGVNELYGVDLGQASTIQDIQRMLAAKAQDTQPGYWVSAFKYDDTKIVDGATGRYRRINRWDLDEAVSDHPVEVPHRGGHIAWYNSLALELAGVDRNTPDPKGGRFERDENGELTGLVEETARDVFDGVAERIEFGREERRAGVAHISALMAASGLTSVHQTGGSSESLTALQDAYQAGEMRFRMYFCPSGSAQLYSALRDAGIRSGFGDSWLRIGAVKYVSDGSNSGRSMAMSTPYMGRPDDYGILIMTQDEVHEAVEEAHRAGWRIGIHSNGDVAIDQMLTAVERVQRMWPAERPMRHRIEHCTLVNPELLRRIRDTGTIPTPFWTYCHFHGNKWAEYGPEKTRWMWAHRSFLDYDIPVPGASDYVPGPFQPMMAIQSMVTRKDTQGRVWGPNQQITVDEALRIGTINGAYASFEEDVKGSITAGKYADWVMLAEDPHDVDPDGIKEIEVLRTELGGQTTHEA